MLCCFQAIITQVNHAIGAEGIISTECKEVVSQYGEMIIELLLAQVFLLLHYSSFFSKFQLWNIFGAMIVLYVWADPAKESMQSGRSVFV